MLFDVTRRFLLLAAILVLCPGAVAAPGRSAAPASPEAAEAKLPRLEIEADEIDLGQVVRGEDVAGRFTFRNVGGDVLRVLKAKPG